MSAEDDEPRDIEAEMAVLGAMLQSADAVDKVREILKAEHYYRPAHRIIHEAITAIHAAGRPVDALTVRERLQADGKISKIGGATYLHDLLEATPSVANAAHYAGMVRNCAERRELIEAASQIRDSARNPEFEITGLRKLVQRTAAKARQHDSGRPDSGADFRRIVLTPASEIPPRPVLWGWEGRLPAAHVSLIAGREGIGKSLLLIDLSAKVTLGTLPGIYEGTPRSVFYCATEDSWQHTIVPRLIAAGADLTRVYRIEVEAVDARTPGSSLTVELVMPKDCDRLAAEIKREEVALVALDPLMSVIDRAVDTYNDRDMRTVLEPLARLADDTGCMIVGLGHFNKSASDDPLNLITGSRAFTAVVRSVLVAIRDPEAEDGGCIVSQAKNNLGRLDLPNLTYVVRPAVIETAEGDAHVGRLHFTGESERSVRDVLAAAASASDRSERAECASWLKEELAAPQRTKEIEAKAREQGFSQRTVFRVRKQLGIKADQLTTGPKGRNEWWLSLPKQEAGDDSGS